MGHLFAERALAPDSSRYRRLMIQSLLTNVTSKDTVVVFPGFGCLVDGGQTWRITIDGAVYEPGIVSLRQKLLLRLLKRVMKADPTDFESEIFRRRIHAFAAATEKGKRIAVRVGDQIHHLQKASKRNGHFVGTLRLSVDEVERLDAEGHVVDGCLYFDVVTQDEDERRFVGRAHLLPRTGISVISDIDDTIKHTEITSRRELLANTFLREFRSIPGMSDVYRQWAAQGGMFHYVSSSPWQLYESLAQLFAADGFPYGTFHLRTFRLRDHMLRRVFIIRRRGKGAVIRSIIESFPTRRFVLVGDSGERDAEIYSKIVTHFPQQIASVMIRELPLRPLSPERRRKLFRNLPDAQLHVFRDPQELPQTLPSGEWLS